MGSGQLAPTDLSDTTHGFKKSEPSCPVASEGGHEIFEREGDDLHCQLPVSMTTASLGDEIDG